MDVDSTLWGSNLEFFKYMFNSTDKNNKQAQVKNIFFLFFSHVTQEHFWLFIDATF